MNDLLDIVVPGLTITSSWGNGHAATCRALNCSVDRGAYYPQETEPEFDLGYMGTYSADRSPWVTRRTTL